MDAVLVARDNNGPCGQDESDGDIARDLEGGLAKKNSEAPDKIVSSSVKKTGPDTVTSIESPSRRW